MTRHADKPDKLAVDIAEYMNAVDGTQTISRFLATGEVLRMVAKIRESESRSRGDAAGAAIVDILNAVGLTMSSPRAHMIAAFVDAAVAAEREACAKIADEWVDCNFDGCAESIVADIRARGTT